MTSIQKTNNDYYYAKVTEEECFNWGGMAVCDLCGEPFKEGYLVFVLGSCICPKCFHSWLGTSKRYEEDLEIQKERSEEWFRYHLGSDVLMPEDYVFDKIDNINKETAELLGRLEGLNKAIEDTLPEIFPELKKEEDSSADI